MCVVRTRLRLAANVSETMHDPDDVISQALAFALSFFLLCASTVADASSAPDWRHTRRSYNGRWKTGAGASTGLPKRRALPRAMFRAAPMGLSFPRLHPIVSRYGSANWFQGSAALLASNCRGADERDQSAAHCVTDSALHCRSSRQSHFDRCNDVRAGKTHRSRERRARTHRT